MKPKRTNVLFIEQVGTSNVQLDYAFWRGGDAAFFSDTIPLANVVAAILNLPQPDVAVCRPSVLDRQWLRLPERIKSWSAGTKALFVCQQMDEPLANKVLRCGFDGIMLGSDDEYEVSSAIDDVLSGMLYLSDEIFETSCSPSGGELSKSIGFIHRKKESCNGRQSAPGYKVRSRQAKSFRPVAAVRRSLETVNV
jgi:hypothetical protein